MVFSTKLFGNYSEHYLIELYEKNIFKKRQISQNYYIIFHEAGNKIFISLQKSTEICLYLKEMLGRGLKPQPPRSGGPDPSFLYHFCPIMIMSHALLYFVIEQMKKDSAFFWGQSSRLYITGIHLLLILLILSLTFQYQIT